MSTTKEPPNERRTKRGSSAGHKPARKKAYTHGTFTHAMVYATLPELLEKRSEEDPELEGHVFWSLKEGGHLERESVTFSQLSERSALLAAGFLDLGLAPGDRVAILGSNCPDWLYVEYAALRIGILLIRLHSWLATGEYIRRVVVERRCRAVIVNPGRDGAMLKRVTDVLEDASSGDPEPAKRSCVRIMTMGEPKPGRRRPSVHGLVSSADRMEDVIEIQDAIEPHDPALAYCLSAGGRSVAFAAFSHFSFVNNVLATSGGHEPESGAKFFSDLPFSWIESGLHSTLCLGVTMVHVDSEVTRAPDGVPIVLNVIDVERIAICVAIPKLMDEVRQPDGATGIPDCVDYVVAGWGSLCRKHEAFCQQTFRRTVLVYGTSECGLAMRTFISKQTANGAGRRRLEPLAHVEVKVTNEEGEIQAVDTPGCLWLRSPYSSLGCLSPKTDGTLTKPSYDKGTSSWINTNDLGIVHEDGTVEVIAGQAVDLV